jgi:membrane protein YqaA with SNARE-associated domain
MAVRILAALVPTASQSLRRWLYHLGGIGLIPVGLLDNSPIPLPGAMDVATIVLCLRDDSLWWYYGLMATVGSVIGGYVSYRLARKGGKAALDRRFSRARVDRVCRIFGRWGFWAIAIPALLPPPVPMVPFLFAAGAMQYPTGKFLVALAVGRTIRYMGEAYLSARYGRRVIAWIANHGHPAVVGIIVVLAAAAAVGAYFWWGKKKKKGKGK